MPIQRKLRYGPYYRATTSMFKVIIDIGSRETTSRGE